MSASRMVLRGDGNQREGRAFEILGVGTLGGPLACPEARKGREMSTLSVKAKIGACPLHRGRSWEVLSRSFRDVPRRG
jgi:hypothetical protein